MTDKIIEIERCCGMETNVKKIMRISSQPFPVKLMIDQKQLESLEFFKYLSSMLTKLLWQKLHLTRRGLFLLSK
jgi:hypothetical protein